MKELSDQYRESAQLIRQRIRELRGMLALTDDPEEIWHLKRRIAELTPMMTQMNDLAWMLEHYYERGGSDYDNRYGLNGKRRIREKKPHKKNNVAYHSGGTDGDSTPDFSGLPHSGHDRYQDSSHKGGKQIYRKSYFEVCRTENTQIHELHLDFEDEIVDRIFGSCKKK